MFLSQLIRNMGENAFQAAYYRGQFRLLWIAGLVGVFSGIAAIFFRESIDILSAWLFVEGAPFWEEIKKVHPAKLFIYPILGGTFVAWFTNKFAPEAKGHGVPEIMDAVATKRGEIRPRVTIVKLLASTISISTGAPVGREGPTALIGATIGSFLGRIFHFPVSQMQMIVGCGAAAGIAATFNAPIAGTMFSLELIVGRANPRQLAATAFSAMIATVIAHYYCGDSHILFSSIRFDILHATELLLYIALGVVVGLVGALFTKTLYKFEDLADRIPIAVMLKGALGGVGIGICLLFIPHISGPSTWDTITFPIRADVTKEMAWFFLLIAVCKLLGTAWALAFGASGGIFAPSLTIGGCLGASYGFVAGKVFPGITHQPAGYALVGMAGFVGAVTQAPLTSVVMIFELTSNISIILPTLACVGVAMEVYNFFSTGSIYTLKLIRRGIHLEDGTERNLLQSFQVAQVMTTEEESFGPEDTIESAIATFKQGAHSTLPVISENREVLGIVSFKDIRIQLNDGDASPSRLVKDVMQRDYAYLLPSHTLHEAMTLVSTGDYEYVPVVSGPEKKSLGRLCRRDLLQFYKNQLTLKQIT